MSQLFIVYLGGSAPKANIELHDIQFVVGETIENTYEHLRKSGFGTIKGLHLDSYKAIKGSYGYQISIQDKLQDSDKKPYFVNLGSYDKSKLKRVY